MTYPRRGPADDVILPRCTSCVSWAWPENTPLCPRCGGAVEPVAVAPTGTVRSVVTVHRGVRPQHLEDGPYDLVLLDLDDGPELITRTTAPARHGQYVALTWATTPAGQEWPLATPAPPSTSATVADREDDGRRPRPDTPPSTTRRRAR